MYMIRKKGILVNLRRRVKRPWQGKNARRDLPRMGEGWGQHARGGTRWDTNCRPLDVSTTFFSLLPRLITVYVEEKEEYLARGIVPLM